MNILNNAKLTTVAQLYRTKAIMDHYEFLSTLFSASKTKKKIIQLPESKRSIFLKNCKHTATTYSHELPNELKCLKSSECEHIQQ